MLLSQIKCEILKFMRIPERVHALGVDEAWFTYVYYRLLFIPKRFGRDRSVRCNVRRIVVAEAREGSERSRPLFRRATPNNTSIISNLCQSRVDKCGWQLLTFMSTYFWSNPH
jgi:hypothetical protein